MPIKTVLFDFMGTCLDWHGALLPHLPSSLPSTLRTPFLLAWRQSYFDANAARLGAGQATEDIDLTHARTLDTLLAAPEQPYAAHAALFTPEVRTSLVAAWHSQPAWPEVKEAVEGLRAAGYEVVVHANGTTRLQLDLCRASGLRFDALLSSQMLGVYKPGLENYERALALVGREARECVTVAAHAYDLRGARRAGMKTVYVYRWTDDVEEDQGVIRGENDAYLESMAGLEEAIAGL